MPLDRSSLASEALRPARDLATTLLLLAVGEPTAVYPHRPRYRTCTDSYQAGNLDAGCSGG